MLMRNVLDVEPLEPARLLHPAEITNAATRAKQKLRHVLGVIKTILGNPVFYLQQAIYLTVAKISNM
jgi:hypothetical protein